MKYFVQALEVSDACALRRTLDLQKLDILIKYRVD